MGFLNGIGKLVASIVHAIRTVMFKATVVSQCPFVVFVTSQNNTLHSTCVICYFSRSVLFLLPSENLEEILIECPLPLSSRYTPI